MKGVRQAAGVVIFDLDGTLIESEQIWRDVRRDFVVANGGLWHSDAQTKMIGMRTDEWARYIHDELHVPLAPRDIEDRVVKAVAARLQDPPVLPGAQAALERLSGAFRLGLASSAALQVVQTVLERTRWNRLFTVVVSADEVPRGKPAPDVYCRALGLLNADPSHSAAVEDSANGIRSAHAAGLAVVAIPNRVFPPDAGALSLAARVIPNLDALTVEVTRAALPGSTSD